MKYDVIISLGEFCATAMALKDARITPETYPFDWSAGIEWDKCGECGFMGKIDLICNDFKNAFNLKDLTEFHGLETKTRSILNKRTGLQYTHDFPWDETVEQFHSEFTKKYNRRVKRLYEKLNNSKNVLFVFIARLKHCFPLSQFDEAYQKLSKKFPKTNIDFLILQDSYDMKTDETYTLYEKEHMKFVLFGDIENGQGNRLLITKQIAQHANMNYFLFSNEDVPCYGLSIKENWGRWSYAPTVIFKLSTGLANQDLELNFKIRPYINKAKPYQKTDIYVNNQKLATWIWKDGSQPETILNVPKHLNTTDVMEIRFEVEKPQSPKELGIGEDTRAIALGFSDLLIKSL